MKAPVFLRGVEVADDLDVARVADAKAVLVREVDIGATLVEAHHFADTASMPPGLTKPA
jgi:hypothetical protein